MDTEAYHGYIHIALSILQQIHTNLKQAHRYSHICTRDIIRDINTQTDTHATHTLRHTWKYRPQKHVGTFSDAQTPCTHTYTSTLHIMRQTNKHIV